MTGPRSPCPIDAATPGPSARPPGAAWPFTCAEQSNQMKRIIFTSVVLLVAVAGCGPLASEDPARKLEGEWVIVELNENGKSVAIPKDTKLTVVIKDQRWYRGQEGGGGTATNEGTSSVR